MNAVRRCGKAHVSKPPYSLRPVIWPTVGSAEFRPIKDYEQQVAVIFFWLENFLSHEQELRIDIEVQRLSLIASLLDSFDFNYVQLYGTLLAWRQCCVRRDKMNEPKGPLMSCCSLALM